MKQVTGRCNNTRLSTPHIRRSEKLDRQIKPSFVTGNPTDREEEMLDIYVCLSCSCSTVEGDAATLEIPYLEYRGIGALIFFGIRGPASNVYRTQLVH